MAETDPITKWLHQADEHYRAGHRLRAIWYYRKVLKRRPESVPALVNLALIYFSAGKKGSPALELLRKAHQVEPENPTILLNLATVTAHEQSPQEALEVLQEAERLNPQLPDLRYNKAHLLARLERWEDALKEINHELKDNPQNPNALMLKEAIQARMNQKSD